MHNPGKKFHIRRWRLANGQTWTWGVFARHCNGNLGPKPFTTAPDIRTVQHILAKWYS